MHIHKLHHKLAWNYSEKYKETNRAHTRSHKAAAAYDDDDDVRDRVLFEQFVCTHTNRVATHAPSESLLSSRKASGNTRAPKFARPRMCLCVATRVHTTGRDREPLSAAGASLGPASLQLCGNQTLLSSPSTSLSPPLRHNLLMPY